MTSDMVPAPQLDAPSVLEKAALMGDLSKMTPMERLTYYHGVCQSLGLNPLTRPFQYITLNGRLTLYATKDCTDQLRSVKTISIDSTERDVSDPDFATWVVTGHDRNGRTDTDIGSVSIKGLAGEAKANAIMKALTKAKRRLTLSLAGLGMLDESELDGVQPVDIDPETGEVVPPKPDAAAQLRARVQARVAPSYAADTEPAVWEEQPSDDEPPAIEPTPAAAAPLGPTVTATAGDTCGATVQTPTGEVVCAKRSGHRGDHTDGLHDWPRK